MKKREISENYEAFCQIAFGETKELAKYNEATTISQNERKRAESEMGAWMWEIPNEKLTSLTKVDEGSSNQIEKAEKVSRKGDAYPYYLTLVNMDGAEKFIIKHFNESLSAENLRTIRKFLLHLK